MHARILLTIIALVFVSVTAAFSQPELDTTFSGDGKYVFSSGFHAATDVLVQPDDKVVLVSGCALISGSYGSCLLRLNPDGSMDNSFAGGMVRGNFGYASFGVAIQNDGKLITVGTSGDGGSGGDDTVVIARYNANGTVDTSFGSGGSVSTNVSVGEDDQARRVKVQFDGKIVVVGYRGNLWGTPGRGFVLRYLPDGTLDSGFATGGVYLLPNAGGERSFAHSLVIQPDGKILVGGSTEALSPSLVGLHFLIRLNSNGTLDSGWDSDGLRTEVSGSSAYYENGVRGIALQHDGKVIAVGNGNNRIYRYNTDGTPDNTFGGGSGFRSALNHSSPQPLGVTVTPGGRINVVGERTSVSSPGSLDYSYLTARYLSDGTPDPAYSGDGFLDFDIGNNNGAWAVVSDSLGRIVMGGRTAMGSTASPWEWMQMSVARVQAPAAPIGISGRITGPSGQPLQRTIVSITGAGGGRSTITNPFGYYSFDNIQAGQNYSVTAHVKGLEFTPEVVFLGESITDLDLEGQPGSLGGRSKK